MSKTRFERLIGKLRLQGEYAVAIVDVIMELHGQIKTQQDFIRQLEDRVNQLEHQTSGHQGFSG